VVNDVTILESYRQHRDEIDVVTDEGALFVLDYIEHQSAARVRALSAQLGWPLRTVLATCESLASRGFVTSCANPDTEVRLTERGRLILELTLDRTFAEDLPSRESRASARFATVKVALVLWILAIVAIIALFLYVMLRQVATLPPVIRPVETINVTAIGADAVSMLLATILGLFAIAGLALYHGGLVRQKNVLATIMQTFLGMAVVTVIWFVYGYSLTYSEGSQFIGDFRYLLLHGVSETPNIDYAPAVPQLLFIAHRLVFAIMAIAIISGAVAERAKLSAFLFFTFLWTLIVYFPIAHMVWGKGGLLNATLGGPFPTLDFAGGTVVHVSSGVSALVCALYLGKRTGYPKEPMPPHSLVLSFIGACLLWIGWFGFTIGGAG
jgi:DNA-binding MarR family transcriptional regulator